MTVLTVLLITVAAALVLACRPIGSPLARFVALGTLLVFGGAALDPAAIGWASAPARSAEARLSAEAMADEALVGAAHAGVRARDLTIVWRSPLANVPDGPLGARAAFPGPALPLQPEALQVRALRAPAVGRPTVLEVGLEGTDRTFAANVTVHVAGREVLHETVELAAGKRKEIAFTPAQPGPHTIGVRIETGDHRVERTGTFVVADAPRVLALEPSGLVAAALRAQGLTVVEARELPPDWRSCAAVVVGDRLPAGQQQELATAVADGTGLFVLAPGFGLPGEPLRGLLPIRPLPAESGDREGATGAGAPPERPAVAPPSAPDPRQPDQPPAGDTTGAKPVSNEPIEVDKRAIAMVLLVDRSGSMGNDVRPGVTKMSYAKTSAQQTANALTAGDEVGIVTFGNQNAGRVVLPLTPADAVDVVRQGVAKLAHGNEMTYLLSGLELASDMLTKSRASVKHIVVITDGQFMLTEKVALRALTYRMRTQNHVTLSLISIVRAGDQDQEFRKEAELLTRDGGGQFLPVEDPTVVPVLVSSEVTRALSKVGRKPRDAAGTGTEPPLPEVAKPKPEPEKPREVPTEPEPPTAPKRLAVRAVAESSLLAPAPEPAWPTLGAATASTAPLDAQVLLVVGDAGWPLLAFGNRGLGRVGAFAADLCGPAGSEFRAEPPFAARLAQWVQSVLPAEPLHAPAPLFTTVTVTPPAPTPRELAELARLGGAPAVPLAQLPATAEPATVRIVQRLASPWSLGALLALLVLGICERWLGLRAFQRA